MSDKENKDLEKQPNMSEENAAAVAKSEVNAADQIGEKKEKDERDELATFSFDSSDEELTEEIKKKDLIIDYLRRTIVYLETQLGNRPNNSRVLALGVAVKAT